ncbi:hypothetical protein BC941DRAFT_26522 [Chlamydoabsidia padenii]|nr:hypothetical protein BC941DRAFT_26522 [Chlamydoabsidia padenii]
MSAEQTKTESPVVDNTTSEPVVESTTHNTTEPVSSEPVITEHTNEGDATTAQDDKPEEKKDDTSKPTPSPSKSGTKRLSLFLSKAKKTLVPDKDEKKSPSENKSLPEEPIVEQEEQQPATEQVPAEETTTPIDTEPTTSEDKQEKRKSNFLNGFFKKVRMIYDWKRFTDETGRWYAGGCSYASLFLFM